MASYTVSDRARIRDNIFQLLADGESLEAIAGIPGWPSRPTLRKWAREDPCLAQLIAHGRTARHHRQRYPFDAAAARALVLRIGEGEPLTVLIREPGMPHRRALNAWKAARPDFAAELERAKAFAERRRRAPGRRRGRWHDYDEATADRIILAVNKGAPLPRVYADPAFPTRAALRRWRRARPDFDAALRMASLGGLRARARARCLCTPDLTRRIVDALRQGESLRSLSRRPDMPGLYALYKWVRDRPDFRDAVAQACVDRQDWFADQALLAVEGAAMDLGPLTTRLNAINKRLGQLNPYPGERRGRQ